jgi:3-oxoacyl-(acyl-carrier-protein) synthase
MTAPGRRALITGIGMINAAGRDAAMSWQAVLDGKSAIGPIGRFDPSGLQISLAAEVDGFTPRATGSRTSRSPLPPRPWPMRGWT